jgi:hypothetical protein
MFRNRKQSATGTTAGRHTMRTNRSAFVAHAYLNPRNNAPAVAVPLRPWGELAHARMLVAKRRTALYDRVLSYSVIAMCLIVAGVTLAGGAL